MLIFRDGGSENRLVLENRFKIWSNDYVDIFVQYFEGENFFERYEGNTIQLINDRYAVVYYLAQNIIGKSISEIGHYGIPKCYGLESTRSLEASNIRRIRDTPTLGLRGEGVLVGIVDTGIDYTNPVFRHEDGSSRIAAIWDQTIHSEKQYPAGIYYGTEYSQEQINLALTSENPFEIVPSIDEIGHGTMLAGIAAGSDTIDRNFSGVVPDSELVIVKLKQAKPVIREFFAIPEDVPAYQENDLIWGVQYLIATARRLGRPMAICIALGSSQSSHDGRGVSSSLLSIGADFPGIVAVTSAGNEGNMRRHFYGSIEATGSRVVEMYVAENERSFSMELWGSPPNVYSIEITTPFGENVPRIRERLVYSTKVHFVFEATEIIINYIMVEQVTGDQLIIVTFRNPTPGLWSFQVFSDGDIPGSFHIWLPMGDFISGDTYFVQSNPYTTITSPGDSEVAITVTAYNPENQVLYQNASKGFTRLNEIKPDFAAPGVNLLSPTLDQGFAPVTGTGAAASHTTGIAAMMLEWGIVKNNYPGIDTVEVKKFLIRGANRSPRLQYPNRDWGFGAVDIYNTFNILRTYL